MTLSELLPSVGGAVPDRVDPELWPSGTVPGPGGDLLVGGVSLTELAGRFGTPCYVLDEADVRRRAQAFRAALPGAEVAYASKALTCRAVLRWILAEGLSLDVCSAGELAVACSVEFPASRILLHGNAKTPEDLKSAFRYRISRIVIDSAAEIRQLAALTPHRQDVLIRVIPGVDAHTHRSVTTGVDGQKFGVPLAEVAAAAAAIRATPNLRLVGLHCHLGSQVRGVAPFEEAVRRLIGLGLSLPQLDIGGGFGASVDLLGLANRVRVAMALECARLAHPVPRLIVEPGRSIVGPAGVTLYRVVSVKPGFVAIDGGMSDNPRPALYGSRYTARLIGRRTRSLRQRFSVVGRHCEAGDIVAEEVSLPADIRPGDLLAVPASGAYHHSMASNYNLVGRPPIIAVRNERTRMVVRRESEEDLLARDLG